MKKKSIELVKVRPRNGTDIYYTSPSWETKQVDGVTFIYVIRYIGIRDLPKLMRKDSLEYVK